jgi:hypothetical protein
MGIGWSAQSTPRSAHRPSENITSFATMPLATGSTTVTKTIGTLYKIKFDVGFRFFAGVNPSLSQGKSGRTGMLSSALSTSCTNIAPSHAIDALAGF